MEKALDNKGRWRNKSISFRMSQEEAKLLDIKVKLSGLAKQDYITRRLLEYEITVIGNPRVYKALKDQLSAVCEELKRISAGQSPDPELLEVLRLMMILLGEMKEEKEWT